MATRASLFALIVLLPAALALEIPPVFVVWNVGQGLWTTMITDQTCWHFDMGGERAPWSKIMRQCRSQHNKVHLSHWDSDHISFVSRSLNLLPNLCRLNWPVLNPSKSKAAQIKKVPECEDKSPLRPWIPVAPRTSNEASSVVLWRNVLVPGDSNKAAEKIWSTQLSEIARTRVLVLGHHGSRTSTSRELLTQMPSLKLAIASARRRRYGHPHVDTVRLLQYFAVPILITEDWGNIFVWQ